MTDTRSTLDRRLEETKNHRQLSILVGQLLYQALFLNHKLVDVYVQYVRTCAVAPRCMPHFMCSSQTKGRFTTWCWLCQHCKDCERRGRFFHWSNSIPDVKFLDNLIGWTLANAGEVMLELNLSRLPLQSWCYAGVSIILWTHLNSLTHPNN